MSIIFLRIKIILFAYFSELSLLLQFIKLGFNYSEVLLQDSFVHADSNHYITQEKQNFKKTERAT